MANRRDVLFKLGLAFSIGAFVLVFSAFASPYWYKSWTRVYSPFANIGLWHVCLSSYIRPDDPEQLAYVGCWWIHSTVFKHVWNNLMPPWFRAIQALVIFTVLCNLVGLIILILITCRVKRVYGEFGEKRPKFILLVAILHIAAAVLVFMVSLIFAEKSLDASWMPRPWMNYLSFSYGFNVLSGFSSAFTGMTLYILFVLIKDKQDAKKERYLPPPEKERPAQEEMRPLPMQDPIEIRRPYVMEQSRPDYGWRPAATVNKEKAESFV